MDEAQLGRMIEALASPQTPEPGSLERIVVAAGAARRRRRAAGGVSAVALVAVVVGVVSALAPGVSQHAQPTSVPPTGLQIESSGHGRQFSVSFDIAYPAPVRVVAGTFSADGRTYDASVWTAQSVDQTDDVTPPLDAAAGETIHVSALVRPDCSGHGQPPSASLTVEVAGGPGLTQGVVRGVGSSQQYLRQRVVWCAQPARASIYSIGHTSNWSSATYTLDVTNTTDHVVDIVCAEFQNGNAHWAPASLTLRPGWTEKLRVTVTGAKRWGPKPWDQSLLTADGQAIPVRH